ncbi:MAG: ChaN family lipoprotein [Salinivirgaceae bacterium]
MKIIPILLLFTALWGHAQPEAYRIYTAEGKNAKWNKMIDDLTEQQLVFFGELHNSAIAHWLQLELAEAAYAKQPYLILGAEMFEADNQLLIDEYFADFISQKSFEDEVRLWNNYETDYKPLVEFAKAKKLKFIGTNIPRRYASLVNKKGLEILDSLSSEAKKYLPPLPVPLDIEQPGYAHMLKMAQHMPGKKSNGENLAKAQAIKDATMAHFIVQHLEETALFLHFNGRYHSDNHDGLVWYIKQYAPQTKLKTITTVLQSDISKMDEDHKNKADYVIVINEKVTDTY